MIAPAHVQTTEAQTAIAAYARNGGNLVVSYLTGTLSEHLHVPQGGYLGTLRDLLGIRIEEFAPAPTSESLRIDGLSAGPAHQWGEFVTVDHATARS